MQHNVMQRRIDRTVVRIGHGEVGSGGEWWRMSLFECVIILSRNTVVKYYRVDVSEWGEVTEG